MYIFWNVSLIIFMIVLFSILPWFCLLGRDGLSLAHNSLARRSQVAGSQVMQATKFLTRSSLQAKKAWLTVCQQAPKHASWLKVCKPSHWLAGSHNLQARQNSSQLAGLWLTSSQKYIGSSWLVASQKRSGSTHHYCRVPLSTHISEIMASSLDSNPYMSSREIQN